MQKTFQLSVGQNKIIDALQHEQSCLLQIDNVSFIVFKWQNTYHIFTNSCPHNRKKLATQDSELMDDSGTLLVCEHHGAMFLPQSGLCVSGPCLGTYLDKATLIQSNSGYQVELP